MAKSSTPPRAEKPDLPGLPAFRERLPSLISALEDCVQILEKLPEGGSYLVAWDRLYECVHTLKGLTRLLPCPPDLGLDVVALCDTIGNAYMGTEAVRDPMRTAAILRNIRASLDSGARLTLPIAELAESFSAEADNEARLAAIPRPLHQMSAFVSKKAFEAVRLGLPMWIVEEEMVLGDYMAWAKRLAAAVRPDDAPHGLLIHSAPQLLSGDGATIHAFGWVAGSSPRDTEVATRLRTSLPKATLKTCP